MIIQNNIKSDFLDKRCDPVKRSFLIIILAVFI